MNSECQGEGKKYRNGACLFNNNNMFWDMEMEIQLSNNAHHYIPGVCFQSYVLLCKLSVSQKLAHLKSLGLPPYAKSELGYQSYICKLGLNL